MADHLLTVAVIGGTGNLGSGLPNAAAGTAAEAPTPVLVCMNRCYRIKGAGMRITGGPGSAK